MVSTLETGHAKNVSNFDKLLSAITGYGSKYNPSRKNLTIPEFNLLKGSSFVITAEHNQIV